MTSWDVCHPGDFEGETSGVGSGVQRGHPGDGRLCDSRYSAWETCDLRYILGGCHPEDSGHVTPDTGSWVVSPLRLWT